MKKCFSRRCQASSSWNHHHGQSPASPPADKLVPFPVQRGFWRRNYIHFFLLFPLCSSAHCNLSSDGFRPLKLLPGADIILVARRQGWCKSHQTSASSACLPSAHCALSAIQTPLLPTPTLPIPSPPRAPFLSSPFMLVFPGIPFWVFAHPPSLCAGSSKPTARNCHTRWVQISRPAQYYNPNIPWPPCLSNKPDPPVLLLLVT